MCHLKKERDMRKEICFTGGMKTTPKIPEIREDERTPLVTALLEIIRIQQEQIQELRDEIARLKGQKPKPKIMPSVLEKYFENKGSLKDITKRPGPEKKAELQERFDQIFTTHTCYEALNQALKRIHKNKPELLMVLERPDVPLHNNTSERDIREYVKKRKISGSTRSDLGRRCRDTFTSLKKTCRKLGIGFWQYLEDRVSRKNSIPSLPDLMRLRVRESPG